MTQVLNVHVLRFIFQLCSLFQVDHWYDNESIFFDHLHKLSPSVCDWAVLPTVYKWRRRLWSGKLRCLRYSSGLPPISLCIGPGFFIHTSKDRVQKYFSPFHPPSVSSQSEDLLIFLYKDSLTKLQARKNDNTNNQIIKSPRRGLYHLHWNFINYNCTEIKMLSK